MSYKCERGSIDKVWQVIQEIRGKSILASEDEYIEIPLIHKNVQNPKEKLSILKKLKKDKAIELIPATNNEEFHKVKPTDKFPKTFILWQKKNQISAFETKEKTRIEKLGETHTAYEVSYIKNTIRINGYFLSRPQKNKLPYELFQVLWDNVGEILDYEKFKRENGEITQTLSKIRSRLGFKKPLNKIFFSDEKEFDNVKWRNFFRTSFSPTVTKRELREKGIEFLNLARFCDLNNRVL